MMDVSRKTLDQHVRAAAEMSINSQRAALGAVLDYANLMARSRAMRKVALIERVAYDETPQWCTVRYPGATKKNGERVVEKTCLFVIEISYTILMQTLHQEPAIETP